MFLRNVSIHVLQDYTVLQTRMSQAEQSPLWKPNTCIKESRNSSLADQSHGVFFFLIQTMRGLYDSIPCTVNVRNFASDLRFSQRYLRTLLSSGT
jgi:hypothetical protein